MPGSSANLGPGFDALAVALGVHLSVDAVERAGQRVLATGEGHEDLPGGDDNLIWRSLVACCDAFGAKVPDVSLRCHNDIPLERGLGSSAAAIVAGTVLARMLTGMPAADAELITLASGMEGHADNVAAAMLGGLVIAGVGAPRRLEPSSALRPLLCVPGERQATSLSRALLPDQVPLAVAAGNAARATLVVAGLTGAVAWDPRAMVDELHEPSRLRAMPPSAALIERVRRAGLAACLSGAGPSVLVVGDASDPSIMSRVHDLAGDCWQVLALAWDLSGAVASPS